MTSTRQNNNLTTGPVFSTLMKFVVPFFISSFLQTFYGMADLMILGLYNGAASTTAVSTGSQITHMLTVIIIGAAMGSTVLIGREAGAGNDKGTVKTIGNTVTFFLLLSVALTAVMLLLSSPIISLMQVPDEAVSECRRYLIICFAGIPFITIYNIISSIFRGLGDSRTPTIFVAIACGANIVLDFVFMGVFGMGAAGAALGTVLAQALSCVIAVAAIIRMKEGSMKTAFGLRADDLRPDSGTVRKILEVGIPVALQDGLIQVSFLVITMIANSRGVTFAAAVGVVEKIISFMFLVPSAMLSALSAMTAQNIGAGREERARNALIDGMGVAVAFGVIACALCHLFAPWMIGLFTGDAAVINAGKFYLYSYSFDIIIAAVHFCFSGYFCGCGRSGISFIHNLLSILLIRIPGAWIASIKWPDTLYPMGFAAPLGSALSALICVCVYCHMRKQLNS